MTEFEQIIDAAVEVLLDLVPEIAAEAIKRQPLPPITVNVTVPDRPVKKIVTTSRDASGGLIAEIVEAEPDLQKQRTADHDNH